MTDHPLATFDSVLPFLANGSGNKLADELRRVYEFALAAHGTNSRESGELYIEHDVAIARTLAELGLDAPSLIAGLLHDILLPHTKVNLEKVQSLFGSEVASLVKGLHNLESYTEHDKYQAFKDNESAHTAEEIRKAILVIIQGDIRIILIRMADYLQDLRKAKTLPLEKQTMLAKEAMNIYAPLANRLGVWHLKWELEDLAFRYLEAERYKEIARRLNQRRDERKRKITWALDQLEKAIQQRGIRAKVSGRPKHIYSIYRKMERKQVDFDHIHDIHALRVIILTDKPMADRGERKRQELEETSLCYQVLGIVHTLWSPVPQEFDDYIANPKPNGYQSLHTAVIDDLGQTLEVQIRTDKMDEFAERGVAAHWAYKEGMGKQGLLLNKRIQELRQTLLSLRDSEDILTDSELFKSEVLSERIYVFTPKGDVVDLPLGATAIDFAYHIHTELGHRCRGAKVNGKMVSLDHKLASGDKVEIIKASKGGPSRDWMNESLGYTGDPRSRSKIRQWFRQQEREQNIEYGRSVVERELKRLNVSSLLGVADVARGMHYEDVDLFLARVGFGDIQTNQITGAIALLQRDLKPDDDLAQLLKPPPMPAVAKGLTVKGLSGLHTKLAGCCSPIAPEPIIGYITRGKGITIHRKDCPTVVNISERERLIEVDWGQEETYPIPLVIRAYPRSGLAEEIATVVRGRNIRIPRAKTTTGNAMTTVYLVAEVASLA
ncbi:MAG: bifunctional (p)ppGpp synthetase/guanosine-3',5'-bis(diphosphate) 3'-pyrophosphohydrolase [Chloroflexi bacterium]|nr:bifunctional (p)ppGpp synthetase/guanosine-3',5'-bis(diphosphate) 3'-pyrophosphohydrolase [Chloroflexota bacterium]